MWLVTPITRDDLPRLLAIESLSPSPWTLAQMEGELFYTGGLQLACRRAAAGELAGFILGRTMADEAEILKLATNPADRCQGVAGRLLQAFLARLRSQGITVCHLELRAANLPARRLYEKNAFLVTGRRNNYYSNPVDDALGMSRSLV